MNDSDIHNTTTMIVGEYLGIIVTSGVFVEAGKVDLCRISDVNHVFE